MTDPLNQAIDRMDIMLTEATDALEEISNIVQNGEWTPGDHPVIDAVFNVLLGYYHTPSKAG